MPGLFRRLRARLRYRDFDADLRRELAVHQAMAEERLRADGVDAEDARYQAARRMGAVLAAREDARAVWIAPWLDSVWQDARYAVRSLRHSPGFTLTALVTLVLGIGVNATLFALVNALLFQPWPVPESDRLVVAHHRMKDMLVGVSNPELTFFREHAVSVDMAATRPVGGTLSHPNGSRAVDGRLASGNYFRVLGVPMTLGRGLEPDDDRPGEPPVAVLGHDLWTAFFASDPGIVGQTVTFRDVSVVVVGVAGPGVRESPLGGIPAVWLPLSAMPTLHPDEPFAREFLSSAAHCCVDLVGRLRPGFGRRAAEAELSTLDRRFRTSESDSRGMRVAGTETAYEPDAAKALPVFGLLGAAALLVLLLTCANVGNLQLARAAARRREITIRLALGAARRRVVRQLLTEGLLLSAAATSLSLVASSIVARAVMLRVEASLAGLVDFSVGGRALLFGGVLTVVTCAVSSLAPALRGSRQLGAGRASDRPSVRLRSTFLAAQVAICVLLLVAAALLGRGLAQAASQDLGFRLDTLMALQVDRRVQSPAGDRAFLGAVMAALEGRPVAAAAVMPLGNASFHTTVRRAGDPVDAERQVRFHPVSSRYFDVLGIPIRSGRTFGPAAADEVVVNEALARVLWPQGGAVGAQLAGADGGPGRRVVGVVGDAHISGLGEVGPMLFQPADSVTYLLFNKGDIAPDALRAVITGIDPAAATHLHAVGDNVGSSLASAAFGARLAGGVGLFALVIVAVGIAGVCAFTVTESRPEIAIRLALGASRGRVRSLVIGRLGRAIGVGMAAGLGLALLAGQALRSYLYGLSPSDPLAQVAALAAVALTAWLAILAPMRRALRIDPATTLRHD
jgi:predicted permease